MSAAPRRIWVDPRIASSLETRTEGATLDPIPYDLAGSQSGPPEMFVHLVAVPWGNGNEFSHESGADLVALTNHGRVFRLIHDYNTETKERSTRWEDLGPPPR